MLPINPINPIAVRRNMAPAAPEISNEDILLSLADENSRIMPISDNNIYFAPLGESKTKGITMEQLRASADLTNRDGDLSNGINAYQLIGQVAQIAREYHAEAAITDLFVADNKNRAQGNGIQINKQFAEAYQRKTGTDNIPFAATTFNRVFCNITLSRYQTDTHMANIVVVTNQRGLQVAIGANCKACRNQTVLGASHMVSSYGNGERSQMDVATFMARVRMMLQGYRFADDMAIIEKMKSIDIPAEEMFKMIGELTAIRVAFDSSNKAVHEMAECKTYPLTSCQVNRFTESLLLTFSRNHRVSLYDCYQSATALYKVASMDLPNVLPQNQAFAEFVNDRYGLGIS